MPVDISYTSYYNSSSNTFYGCRNVAQIHYTYGQTGVMPDKHNTSSSNTNRYWGCTLEGYSNGSLKSVYLEEGITATGDCAFYSCNRLTTVVIPTTLTSIGNSSFHGCTSLAGVDLPEGLTYLGSYAFSECTSLTEIHFPSTLTAINNCCFRACEGLTELVIPDNITYLGNHVFKDCKNITSITIPVDISYNSFYNSSSTFEGCYNVSQIRYTYGQTGVMPDKHNTSSSNTNRYWGCTLEGYSNGSLKSVYLEEGITATGDCAFYSCNRLTTVVIPTTLTSIGNSSFHGCTSLAGVDLPEGLTYLGSYAFSECTSLTEIHFPSTLTAINNCCFRACEGLTELVIPDNITYLGNHVFKDCKNITSITIPVDISYNSFYNSSSTFEGCYNVSQIRYTYGQTGVMPDKHTTAATNAGNQYWGCTLEGICRNSLKSVYLEEGITAIGNYAFYNCSNLDTAVFAGDAPNTIASNSFSGVTSDVYYPIENETWTETVFQGYGGNLTWIAYTPDESDDIIPVADAPAQEETQSVLQTTPVDTDSSETTPVETFPVVSERISGSELYAVFPGENSSQMVEDFLLETSTFSGLVPGEEYVMLAMVSLDADDLLSDENLLFINQAQADEDGKLSFTYRLRIPTVDFYLVACGASNMNLSDAVITFPEMVFNGESAFVHPTVIYNGETLVEFVDYVIVDGTSYPSAGTFTCVIRGIYNYTGLVECDYQVAGSSGIVVNGLNRDDVSYNVHGQTVTVEYDKPCIVGYWDDTEQKYIAIAAEKIDDDSYSFNAPDEVTEVLIVMKGDINEDGRVTASDIARLNAYLKGKVVLAEEALFTADVNGDSLLDNADILALSSAILGKSPFAWEVTNAVG